MPDLYAQVPDGTYLQFPGNTKPEVMQRAVKNYLTAAKTRQAPKPAAPPNGLQPMQATPQQMQQLQNVQAPQGQPLPVGTPTSRGVEYQTPLGKVQHNDPNRSGSQVANAEAEKQQQQLAAETGFKGVADRAGHMAIDTIPMVVAGAGLPELLAGVAADFFTAKMAGDLVTSLQDKKRLATDPKGYWGDALVQASMMGLPHVATKMWAGMKAGAEAAGVPKAEIIAAEKRIGPMRKVGPGIEGKEAKRIGPGTGFTAHKEGISTGTEPPARSRKPVQTTIPDRQFKGTDTTRRPAPGVAPEPKRTVLPDPTKPPKPVRRPAPGVLPKPPPRVIAGTETPKPSAKVEVPPPPPAAKARSKAAPPKSTKTTPATIDGEKIKPNTGLTLSQETFVANKLRSIADEMAAKGPLKTPQEPVTIKVPGDGTFTVKSFQQANNLHATITGEPLPLEDGSVSKPDVKKARAEGMKKPPIGTTLEPIRDAKGNTIGHTEPTTRPGFPKGTRTGSRTAGKLQFGVRPGSPEAKAIDKFREFNDWRKSMGYGMKPVLGRISPDAQREVTNHESSKTIAAIQSHYRIPEVTKILDEGQSRKTPNDLKGRFLTYGVADRAIAERNRVIGELTKNQADYTTQVRAVKDARNAVIRAQNAVKLSKGGFKEVQDARRVLTNALDEANKTKSTIKEQTDQLSKIAVQRAKNPLLDPISGKPITESSVKSFMADPIVKRAVDAHNKHVQPILDANQSAQGGVLTGVRGQYSGMYVPADALDEAGGPAHLGSAAGGANSAGLRAPLAQLGANTSDKHFTGTAHSYSGDYEEVIRERFRSGYDRATERNMHQTLINKNIERPLTIQTEKKDAAGNVILDKAGNPVMQNVKNPTVRTNPDHPSQLEMNTGTKAVPRWEPAEIVKLQDRVQGGLKYSRLRAGKGLGPIDPTIHAEVAIPTRVWKEMRPIFETAHKSGLDRLADTAFSSFMEKYLTGFAEVNAHMLAQASNVTHAKRFMQGFGGKSAIPSMLQTPIEFIRNFNPKSYDAATKRIAITKAAKAGIVPPDWPYQYRDIANSTSKGKDIAWNVAHASRHKLYGEDGIITNAAASIYTEWKALGYDKSPNGEKMLYDAYRFLNTFGATDDAGLQKIFRSLGGGTFYRTGIKNQTAALKAGKAVFAAGLAANVVTWTAGFMAADEKHRKPWEVPGAKLFDIPLPGIKSKDGGQVYINTQFLDRSMMNYGAKRVGADSLMHAVADKMHWTNAALQLGADEINVRSPLATSGPLPAGIESATTLSPFAVPNEKLTGLKTIPGASADYRLTDIRRWLNLIQAELPLSQTGMSMQGDRGASKIANTSAQVLNSVIKTLGMGQLHVAEPENKVLQRVRAAEQANARVGQPKRERAPAKDATTKQMMREFRKDMK